MQNLSERMLRSDALLQHRTKLPVASSITNKNIFGVDRQAPIGVVAGTLRSAEKDGKALDAQKAAFLKLTVGRCHTLPFQIQIPFSHRIRISFSGNAVKVWPKQLSITCKKKFSRSPITGCVSLEMPFQYIHKELCLSELTICYFLSCAFLPFFSYKKCFSDEMGAQLRLLLIYNIVLAKAGITRLVVRPWALATLWLAINVPFLS
jgi:hypothetical protein